jgi:hypothetical protein
MTPNADSERVIECEDCGDPMRRGTRRKRCRYCKKLLCVWCLHHGHGPAYAVSQNDGSGTPR